MELSEMSLLSLRMSQVAGPNDAMFFVVGNSSVSSSRYVDGPYIGVMLGFGDGFYHWGDWETYTAWQTDCSRSGYLDPTAGSPTSSCTSQGAIFVR